MIHPLKVEASSLQGNYFLAGKDIIHAYAVVRYAGHGEIAFVNLLALHCGVAVVRPDCRQPVERAIGKTTCSDQLFSPNIASISG
jgi:hypothetical protein